MDCLNEVDIGDGWRLLKTDQLDSTNRQLAKLARQGSEEGTCLSTRHQTGGRGRLGRTWKDIPGTSILVSVLLRPHFGASDYFAVTCAFSVALQMILEETGISAKIKWPNDLLVGGEKIAGLLGEIGEAGSRRFLIAGLGLNLNQTVEELVELARPATSIRIALGRRVEETEEAELLLRLLRRFRDTYLELQLDFAHAYARLIEQYRMRCSTINQYVSVELNQDETIRGHVIDISNQGHLMVEAESEVRTITAGDVYHLYGY